MSLARTVFEELSISYTALLMFAGSAALLFFPDKLHKYIAPQPWIVDYHQYIRGALLLSGLYFVLSVIVSLIAAVDRMSKRTRKERILNEVMENLTQEEMKVLNIFYDDVDHKVHETVELNFLDSKVQWLEDKGVILSLAFSGVGRMDCPTCPMVYMLNPKAKEYLLKTVSGNTGV